MLATGRLCGGAERPRRAPQLLPQRLHVVQVDVRVARVCTSRPGGGPSHARPCRSAGRSCAAGCQGGGRHCTAMPRCAEQLRHAPRDVERHAEPHVAGALVEEAGELPSATKNCAIMCTAAGPAGAGPRGSTPTGSCGARRCSSDLRSLSTAPAASATMGASARMRPGMPCASWSTPPPVWSRAVRRRPEVALIEAVDGAEVELLRRSADRVEVGARSVAVPDVHVLSRSVRAAARGRRMSRGRGGPACWLRSAGLARLPWRSCRPTRPEQLLGDAAPEDALGGEQRQDVVAQREAHSGRTAPASPSLSGRPAGGRARGCRGR